MGVHPLYVCRWSNCTHSSSNLVILRTCTRACKAASTHPAEQNASTTELVPTWCVLTLLQVPQTIQQLLCRHVGIDAAMYLRESGIVALVSLLQQVSSFSNNAGNPVLASAIDALLQ